MTTMSCFTPLRYAVAVYHLPFTAIILPPLSHYAEDDDDAVV